MITRELAGQLRDAGLRWHPAPGDAFSIVSAELEGDVFTVSDMTIESHEFDTGTILGFSGTTEWALDSVAIEDALWLPREDQLRELLGARFLRLESSAGPAGEPAAEQVTEEGAAEEQASFSVTARVGSADQVFTSGDVACAYAGALVALIRSTH